METDRRECLCFLKEIRFYFILKEFYSFTQVLSLASNESGKKTECIAAAKETLSNLDRLNKIPSRLNGNWGLYAEKCRNLFLAGKNITGSFSIDLRLLGSQQWTLHSAQKT